MKKIHNPFKHIYETSIFSSLINKAILFIKRQMRRSVLVGALCSYSLSEETVQSGFIARLLSAIISQIKKLCRVISGLVEDSWGSALVSSLRDRLMRMSLQSYGCSLSLFGFVSLAVCMARAHFRAHELILSEALWVSLVLLVVGLVISFSRQSLSSALNKSVILSFVLFRLVGFRKGQIPSDNAEGHNAVIPMAAVGILLGVSSHFVHVGLIVLAFVGVVALSAILCAPELGVILCFLALPFVTTMQITALTLLSAVSFILKLIRGKRYVTIGKMDICIILFAAVLLCLGGLTSITPTASMKSVIMFLVFILMYFITSNSLNTYKWVSKAASALTVAGLVSALVGIYQNFAGFDASLIWVDTAMFNDISARVIGTFDNPNVFGEFLILALPIAIALFATRKGLIKCLSLISSVAMCGALILTYSRGAWLGFAAAMMVFLVLYDDVWIKIGIVCLAASPFLIQFVPSTILSRVTSIGNLADTSTSYRLSIWVGATRMLGDFWVPGIGVGTAAFLSVYPAYALSGAGYAQHAHNLYLQIMSETGVAGILIFFFIVLCFFKMTLNTYSNISMWEIKTLSIAVAAGVGAFLLQGMTDYVWYNYRITLLFWMILGLASALYRSGCREWGEDRENIGEYKLKGRKI